MRRRLKTLGKRVIVLMMCMAIVLGETDKIQVHAEESITENPEPETQEADANVDVEVEEMKEESFIEESIPEEETAPEEEPESEEPVVVEEAPLDEDPVLENSDVLSEEDSQEASEVNENLLNQEDDKTLIEMDENNASENPDEEETNLAESENNSTMLENEETPEAELPELEENLSETEEETLLNPDEEIVEPIVEEDLSEEEEYIQILEYEDDKVIVTVTADDEEAIPENASLSVTPIEKIEITEEMSEEEAEEAEKINEQYDFTEQKLNEKAEEETYNIAGFLAYDITFVDKDGNKTEPNGNVKVTMKYKEAALPEKLQETDIAEIAENVNIDVTVMHLEEDEEGKVKEVVDMVADETKEAAIETTESAEVAKAEFVTDNFSTFTLTWVTANGSKKAFIYFVNEKEEEINWDGTVVSSEQLSEGVEYILADLAEKYPISGYEFVEGRLMHQKLGSIVTAIKYDKGGWWCKSPSYDDGNAWNQDYGLEFLQDEINIYLCYKEKLGIETEDTANFIDINLYDYDNDSFGGLEFNGGTGNEKWNKNSGNKAVQGIVDDTLYDKDGNPVTLDNNYQGYLKSNIDNSLMTRLFADTGNEKTALGLNHLFSKSKDGYYEYDSEHNYAYYDPKNGKNFIVYDVGKDKGGDNIGDFTPWIDLGDGTDNAWHHGMTVGFNFIQPKDGMINNKEMIFSFKGDDDVWVFIDGQLVLDIGGIHGAVGGSINFATGVVEVDNATSYKDDAVTIGTSTTLDQLFSEKISKDSKTFDDYSEHRLEFFYLERGAGNSNCKLKFNIPPLPKDTLRIKKEITNTDKDKYVNLGFTFKVYLEGNGENGEEFGVLKNCQYQIWEDNRDTGETGMTNEEGEFILKHNQTAVFSDIPWNLRYYVEEIDVSSEEFDQVDISGWDVSYWDENGNVAIKDEGEANDTIPNGKYTARSAVKRVGGNSQIVFENRCSAYNLRELRITKEMAQSTDDTFKFKIYLEGTNGNLIPYEGSYYLTDTNNKSESRTTSNGIVENVPAGYTIVLTNILSGTSFKVEEIDLNEALYDTPQKELKTDTYEESTIEGADGQIKLGKDAEVVITNFYKGSIDVTKVWSDGNNIHADDQVYIGLYDNNETPLTYIKIDVNSEWKGSFIGLNTNSSYEVKELKLAEGTEGQFKINENGVENSYIGIESEQSLNIKGKDYQVTYSNSTSKVSCGESVTITNTEQVTNTYTLKIHKVSAKSGNEPEKSLSDAEFKLLKKGDNGFIEVSTDTTDENGNLTFSDLEVGVYQIREIKAPAGYAKLSETINIKITDEGTVIFIDSSENKAILIDNVTKETEGTETTLTVINHLLYELPSTGGSGIYLYITSGILLMMAAMLMLYKNRHKGVLKF